MSTSTAALAALHVLANVGSVGRRPPIEVYEEMLTELRGIRAALERLVEPPKPPKLIDAAEDSMAHTVGLTPERLEELARRCAEAPRD